jgi:hypothetical protein
VTTVIPYQSKLSPGLRNVADPGRRSPSVIVPSAEGAPAEHPLDPEQWYEQTQRLFDASEQLTKEMQRQTGHDGHSDGSLA